ncbi:MAG TPA: tripartite tricarboxylate transporter substrate binding protein [Xanthobacteraceae bacterium]
MRELLTGLCSIALSSALPISDAMAESYPSHPIQIIVPATPGGPVDTAIRVIEPELSTVLGTPLVLVNRPGASGIVGMSSVATAAPTGYTLGAGVSSIFTVVHISGSSVPFTIDDFLLIGNYASDVSVLAVSPDSPWRSFDEFIVYARDNPGKLSYASAGAGTMSSLSMQAIISASKLDITAVPFAGGAQATMAVIGRHVDAAMVPYSTGAQMMSEGKLRPLLTTAPARLAPLPDTPTMSEKGLPTKGFNLVLGLYAPKQIPQDAISVLIQALRRTMDTSSVAAKLEKVGLFPHYEDPQAAHARLDEEFRDIVALDRKLNRPQ